MKILVAEDEPILLKTIELRLKKDGYEVITSIDGREALAKITEHQPDLIIADIMMPFASGLEIVGAVKKRNRTTPVIILSAMEKESVVLEAFQLGADDYITKPFSLNELSVRVKRFAQSLAHRNH
jgi:DNA-binding response OmpR family regulator